MGVPANFAEEMEPKVHSIIKKQLGFSEPSLLSAAMKVIGSSAASKDTLTSEFEFQLQHELELLSEQESLSSPNVFWALYRS